MMTASASDCFPEPPHRNAGFIRQNRSAGHALPDESGVPHARWFMVSMRDHSFANKHFPAPNLLP
jgi:hypothetical protein